jgi:hypothetical protein
MVSGSRAFPRRGRDGGATEKSITPRGLMRDFAIAFAKLLAVTIFSKI